MEYFPLFLKLTGRSCLVIGGGSIAFRKVSWLLRSGAVVHVLAPDICQPLQELANTSVLKASGECDKPSQVFLNLCPKDRFTRRALAELPLNQHFLVVAATSDEKVNQHIATRCQALDVHCNVASHSSLGDTILPAIIDRSPVVLALHSGAKSPTVTRYLKRQLEAFVPQKINVLVDWAENWRSKVKKRLPASGMRQRLWDRVLSGMAAEHLYDGQAACADKLMQDHLAEAETGHLHGEVFLVGAGPGDPELLTLKALRLIQQADVVLYDRLVSEPILQLLPASCERIYVGKRQADHAVPQVEINQRLVDLAKQGRNVLRLKGGDPFIFGRGGEEIELLAASGVSFQVVPGITAASGCSSYAGIPLTHRDYSQSVRFITGHLKNNQVNLPWPELAMANQTLVFYMGLTGLEQICQSLILHGRAKTTPAAIVEKGTTPQQRVISATLETLATTVAQQKVSAPTLLIIGEVVQLQSQLAWFNR
ncbi:uroporphyrinogen-III C-methyltransferase [Aestuariicella hydrocarbonica]|uniref:Siroheme synthase n=1 Tax=Pseudomaricurvus hydrocarbonicus TaxID=1470433 RepID=A0A9E5JZB6_9GAMM|nr:siroheme synthase CysG [Aestuariicella hydrocarbonica]NHO65297.1 uroporphyrinogen-III C-methyltransferase [Aestuariicella hydrocarbonica]